MSQTDVELTLGAFFVIFNAYERFNTPHTNRSSTTALRYFAAAVAYAALAFATFFVLSRYPALLKLIGQDAVPESVANLPPALMTALVLTVLLEKIPLFSASDRWLRLQLQKMANIPYEARRLSRWLQRSEFSAPVHLRERVGRRLRDNAFQERDITFDRGDSIQHLWSKIAALMEHIEGWEAEYHFSGFMANSVEDFKNLAQCYEQLSRKAAWTFKLVNDPAPAPMDQRGAEVLAVYRAEFSERAEALFASLCDFVSRGVLRCRVSHTARCAEIRAMGFLERRQRGRGLSLNQLISVFAMVASILLFGSMLAGSRPGLGVGQQLLLVAMVATGYCIAIACAVYPKYYWQMARRGPDGERPSASYLLWGTAAAVLSQLANFGFKWLIFGFDMERALADVQLSYPWALLTFTTAVVIAYLADNDAARLGRWLRLIEGLTAALATVLIAYVTYRWLQSIGNPAAQKSQFLLSVVPMTAMNGFLLGYVVPTWHRNAAQLRGFSRGDDGEAGPSVSLLRFDQRTAGSPAIAAHDVSAAP
jgi:hypothetical protein